MPLPGPGFTESKNFSQNPSTPATSIKPVFSAISAGNKMPVLLFYIYGKGINSGEHLMIQQQALVRAFIDGDFQAAENFFRVIRPRLFRASMHLLGGSVSEAEEIVEMTFRIARSLPKSHLNNVDTYSWLRQICVRLVYSRLRLRRIDLRNVSGIFTTWQGAVSFADEPSLG